MVLGTMKFPSSVLWMAPWIAVGPLRALTVSGGAITTFISDEKLVSESGNSIEDETIDYSVDVGLSVLAACWFAAFSPFVLALSAAFCPCGSTHSLELRSFPGLGFQHCIFDGLYDLGGLPVCLVIVMIWLTGTQLQMLILLACACGSLCILASDGVLCLHGSSLMAVDRVRCLMASTTRASAALRLHCDVSMAVALAAAFAFFYISGQVMVHAVAAFEAASALMMFGSLLTGPAASAPTFFATVKTGHAAAAPAAADNRFFHHDLLAEAAAASEYEVADVIQPAAAASAAAKDQDGGLPDSPGHVFELVLRFFWSLVCVSGLGTFFETGYFAVLRHVPVKDMLLPHGQGKNQSFKKEIESVQERFLRQAHTPKALIQAVCSDDSVESEGEYGSFKGKDRHDIDGSLSLGLGQATGRVDVPVGVTINAEELCRSGQSVALVSPGSCVVKTIFVKGVDGNTVVHGVHEHTVVGHLLDCTMDVWVTYNGKLVQPGDTIGHIGIGKDDTLRCHGRLRGGAQRYRSQPVDIPGQWTCQACGQERVWPVKTRCFRCGCPKGHVPLQPEPFPVGPLGRAPQRSAPTNPTFRPPRQKPKVVPPKGATNFPPLNQPSSVGVSDASASGAVPAFPAGSLDWLVAFLRQIMSPEDFEKYKSSFDPTPAKEEEPLAVQLANKTKEMGTVMRQIEHYRNVCRDLEVKLMRQGELLDENIARKAALQDEINEVEARIAAEENGPPPAAPPGPPPEFQEAFPPPPEEDMDEDTQMENEAPDTGAGVGVFAQPSKKRMVKSAFRKRASLRLSESRSSVFTRLSKLSPPELLRLSEQCTALAKSREPDLGIDEPALPATEEDDLQGTQYG